MKKIVLIGLLFFLVLSLAACGGSSPTKEVENTETNTAEETEEPETMERVGCHVGDTFFAEDGIKVLYLASGDYWPFEWEGRFASADSDENSGIYFDFAIINEGKEYCDSYFGSHFGYLIDGEELLKDGQSSRMSYDNYNYYGESNLTYYDYIAIGGFRLVRINLLIPKGREDADIRIYYSKEPLMLTGGTVEFDQTKSMLYEGVKNSGIKPAINAGYNSDALRKGEVYEDEKVKITYLDYSLNASYWLRETTLQINKDNIKVILKIENKGDQPLELTMNDFVFYCDGRECHILSHSIMDGWEKVTLAPNEEVVIKSAFDVDGLVPNIKNAVTQMVLINPEITKHPVYFAVDDKD